MCSDDEKDLLSNNESFQKIYEFLRKETPKESKPKNFQYPKKMENYDKVVIHNFFLLKYLVLAAKIKRKSRIFLWESKQ